MASPAELDVLHHDFAAKLRSVHDALSEPLDAEAAACAIEVALLLREPMWRQAAWRDLDRDAALAAGAAVRLGFPEKAAALLVYRAGIREALGEWAGVEPLVQRALELGSAASTRAEAMLHLGAAAHNLGQYSKAKSAFARGLEACRTAGMRHRLLQKLSRTERAIGHRDRALAIVNDLIGGVSPTDLWFHAELKLDKAAFFRGHDPKIALALAQKAKEMYVALRFSRGEAYANLELARNLRRLGDAESALACLSQAKALFDRTSYKPGASHVRFEQARIALDHGEFEEAFRLLEESYDLARRACYFGAIMRASLYQCYACGRARRLPRMLRVGLRVVWLLATHAGRLLHARYIALVPASWRD